MGMTDLDIVKRYIWKLIELDLQYKYITCGVCDSDQQMMCGSTEDDEVYLFCLAPKCSYRMTLGYNTIQSMKEDYDTLQ